jgi:hypothetical protein
MADYATKTTEEEAPERGLSIWELQKSDNIEPLLGEELSDEIGRAVYESYEIDKQSRSDWEERMENAIKLALQIVEKKSVPWPNASNVKFPLVTIGALQFSARSYPVLVKPPEVVKYRVVGEDPNGEKAARAQRISHHMSYQLLEEDENWEEDFDKALIALPILGTVFKKSFYDPVKRHNISKLVLPQNLVVSYYANSIEDCERKTEEFELYDREIRARQLRGVYSDKELGNIQPRGDKKISDKRQGVREPTEDKKKPRPLLEQHCYWDLDDDGLPEPYVIVVDKSSKKCLRIVNRFSKVETEQSLKIEQIVEQIKTIDAQVQQIVTQLQAPTGKEGPQNVQALREAEQMVMQLKAQQQTLTEQARALQQDNEVNPKVLNIEVEEYYTKYGFIPSPDGGFYDLGMGALLGPLNDSVNTLINQLIDSGTLNNGNHGFIGRGARIEGGVIRFNTPYEWKRVNVAGQTLKDSLVPLPVNMPSPVLFNLLSLLISYAERVSSVNDAMSGSNPGQNTPAYNYHAMLEQGLQLFNGIFKRIYRSFRKEARKLYMLNRQYVSPVKYFETLDGPMQIGKSDYSGDPKDLMPAADPNAFSNMEKLSKAHFVAERMSTVPHYNTVKGELLLLEAMDIPSRQEIYPIDEKGQPLIPAPPNPEIQLKAEDQARKTIESKARQETNAVLAESKVQVDRSQTILNQYKAGKLDADATKEQFDSITKRFEALTDRLKVIHEKDAEAGSESD